MTWCGNEHTPKGIYQTTNSNLTFCTSQYQNPSVPRCRQASAQFHKNSGSYWVTLPTQRKGLRLSTLCSWMKSVWFSHCPGAQWGTGSFLQLQATEIISGHAFDASLGTMPAPLPPCTQPGWVGCLNCQGPDIWDCSAGKHQGAKPNQWKCANFCWYQLLLIVP